ncbi:MAG: gfo/Idh/MocA family oxidoreductase, partial [Proteobacteria bacterium]|nr:gfo/Idh/MocA family oxidoreductase [Pseudomonadota bacterium]
ANVARAYDALAQDLRNGTSDVPDFAFALQRHRLLAAIEESARTGDRIQVS